ncbi:MAG: mechanosensitive ion channel [Planctomycetes bacterium]|nr:mechanosensitive ion channel [Planctomycetota bacterium]
MMHLITAALDLNVWLEHAPRTAGPAAVAAGITLVLLILVLPREQRRKVLQPFAYLVLASSLLLLEELVDDEQLSHSLSVFALLFLFASIGRSAFVLFTTLVQQAFRVVFPRIYLDLGMALVYLPLAYAALLLAGVKIDNIVAGSAVISVVLGLAMQSTLGNFFAGLAIQFHRPFSVGDWIQFDDKREHIGKVRESNWRATTVVTLDEVEVVIPNNKLAELPLTNFYRPDRWSRRSIYFVCSYAVPPREVQRIVLAAIQGSFGVLDKPTPSIVTNSFTERGIEYWLRFFTVEMDRRDGVDGGVRDRIWYALNRHGISMPVATHEVTWQQRSAETERGHADRSVAQRLEALSHVPLFRELPRDVMQRLAQDTQNKRYISGETIIRQGDEGAEMFVVLSGETSVLVRADDSQEAHLRDLGPGAFFGETSMLQGSRRTATVRALHDCELLVIDKVAMTSVLKLQPDFLNRIVQILEDRQVELNRRLAELPNAPPPQKEPLLVVVKRWFGLD